MKRINEVHYPEGELGDEALTLKRVRIGMLLGSRATRLAQDILDIKQRAWQSSAWFRDAVADTASSTELLNKNFDMRIYSNLQRQKKALWKSIFGVETFYVAERNSGKDTSDVVSFGRFRSDVSKEDTFPRRLVKRTADFVRNHLPSKIRSSSIGSRIDDVARVYEAIGDVDTKPGFEHRHIGAAVVDLGLRNAPQERRVTTYVASTNEPLIARLGDIGLVPTGDHPRPDLYGESAQASEVRLEGGSVAETLEQLHDRLPMPQAA